MLKQHKSFFFLLILSVALFSCSKQEVTSVISTSNQIKTGLGVKARNFASEQLEAHYQKHGMQFGSITQDEYLQQAQTLLDAPVTGDVLEKTRPNGDILHYRLSTGEFAIMTRTGRIRTYFKVNEQYWMRQ